MSSDGWAKELVSFFKTARHLWGRCPGCGTPFRLSDAAISASAEPPRDWLRRLERKKNRLDEFEAEIAGREAEIDEREDGLHTLQQELEYRERNMERNAHNRVREILSSRTEVRALIRKANQDAVKRSRATLLGKMLERVAPCFRRFGYDPRDMRCICDPVDYVLFDGLTVDRQVREIRFIEVKCGRSRLSAVQRSVREVVDKAKVYNETWEIGDPDIPITKQLPPPSRRALPSGR